LPFRLLFFSVNLSGTAEAALEKTQHERTTGCGRVQLSLRVGRLRRIDACIAMWLTIMTPDIAGREQQLRQ
jgi:hypothetical protein